MKNRIYLKLPATSLPKSEQHFLLFIPWEEKYLQLVPEKYRNFFVEILPKLSARTANVHTAVCMQFLDEFIYKTEQKGEKINRDVIAYSLMLHDSGWSQMDEKEIAASLGVKGLVLNKKSIGPKKKHAILSEKIARNILVKKSEELKLSKEDINLICKAILYHDQPEKVAGLREKIPIEIQLLVDLDHIWSFTQLNFWQDVKRKGVDPGEYLINLKNDLDMYFVTAIGKEKARELLSQRKQEVDRYGISSI